MGIEQPRLLSEAEREEIAGQLAQATPADRPAIIADLRARYGQHAGMLAAELAGEVDANTALLIAHADMPHLPRLLAQSMAKSAKDDPAKPRGEATPLPVAEAVDRASRSFDMGRMLLFQQYTMPGGQRVEYDGEALIPVATVQVSGNVELPGGATVWPGARSESVPTDWGGIGRSIGRIAPRVGTGVGVALSTLVTPWNAQEEYHYFGDGGATRLRTRTSEFYGVVEERNPETGEWLETGLLGYILGTGAGSPPLVVTGTPEQVDRAGRAEPMAVPDGQLPPPPGLVPPIVPDMGEETFPAEESGPLIHITPEVETGGDTEAFPIPEKPRAQADVFLALSDEIIREIMKPLEAHRGDEYTRRGNDIVVRKVYEQLERWFPDVRLDETFTHEAGATLYGKGEKELKERIVRNGKDYSIPDVKIRDTGSNGWIALNTGAVLKDGSTLIAAERRQLERLRQNLGYAGVAAGLPKLRPDMDEAEYTARVEQQLEDFFTDYFGRPPGS